MTTHAKTETVYMLLGRRRLGKNSQYIEGDPLSPYFRPVLAPEVLQDCARRSAAVCTRLERYICPKWPKIHAIFSVVPSLDDF